jgi:rhodanese-related sulfurtransferase
MPTIPAVGRHCPKCQGDNAQRWLDLQRARLLPCAYYFLTFTLPQELRRLARSHQKVVYGILLRAAAAAVIKLCADPRYLGARPGLLGVLHTWTRAMLYHPHAHFLVTAGGLSADAQSWLEPANPKFLIPGRALSVIFRGKLKHALRQAGLLDQVPPGVWHKDKKWVVHCQLAGRGDQVLAYLSRYLFRIAIANSRLQRFQDGQVTFSYRDSRSHAIKLCTISAAEFITRFLQHVLPSHFTKVRYYGLFSSSRSAQLDQVRPFYLHRPRPILPRSA